LAFVRTAGYDPDLPLYRRVVIVGPPTGGIAGALTYAGVVAAASAPDVIHVVLPAPPHASSADEDALTSEVSAALPRALSDMASERRLTVSVLHGHALEMVLREVLVRRADLLLVGSRRLGEDRRVLERRLAMQAPCSVWVVPAGAPASLARILAPVDFSERSADALEAATAIAAAARSVRCQALHVRFDSSVAPPDDIAEAVAGRERDAFTTFAARANLHGIEVEPLFEEGPDVTRTILRVAAERGSDLIVMGTRGRTRAASMLLGSETEHTLQSSGVPVLAVKHFGSRLRFSQALLDARFRHRGGPRFG
jgi:nucleotide-binding universal stress UspA family protein